MNNARGVCMLGGVSTSFRVNDDRGLRTGSFSHGEQ